ncbi:hypothetical protein [Mesorhizobium sp. M2A.F.Ca.ET.067.02.1.1]|uniref:hypothetical protein n=1 Tax=Mesorhizobium sp. M2A.F.Ca.ET.067.02.1.1 TaxID=2496749 RepID=UPI000FD49A04|nr:hypothetical protein [Mesorhizobium sp. M2A.F.Ca.ET.067.02.1.1]RUW64559.1 hypothetical protein EOA28_34810 [Mesorhizobium sp. M2A.F.Ca.ET.067.02.1.1]
MTQLFASADFSERLVPRSSVSFAPAASDAQQLEQLAKTAPSYPKGAVDAAPPEPPSPGGAAFLHFTESSFAEASEDRSGRQVATAPEQAAPAATGATVIAGAVAHPMTGVATPATGQTAPADLSGAGAVVLSNASRFILRLIAAHDGRDEADVLAKLIVAEGKRIGLSPLLAAGAEDIGDDLGDLPDFARRAQNRFRAHALEADGHKHLRGQVFGKRMRR